MLDRFKTTGARGESRTRTLFQARDFKSLLGPSISLYCGPSRVQTTDVCGANLPLLSISCHPGRCQRRCQQNSVYNSAMAIFLACIAGALTGRKAPVGDQQLTIGRDPSNKLVLPDPTISRFHARAFLRGDDVLIVDLDSKLGTYVDGVRIAQPTLITPQSQVHLGSVRMAIQGTLITAIPPRSTQPAQVPTAAPAPPAGCLLVAIGKKCALEVYRDKVRITRQHGLDQLLIHGLKGDREIYLRTVSGIVFKPVGTITVGYLQFTFAGGLETKRALLDAVQDSNTVIFEPSAQPMFEQAKALIEQLIASIHNPASHQSFSPADELAKLHQLLQVGAITQSEFDTHKRRLGF